MLLFLCHFVFAEPVSSGSQKLENFSVELKKILLIETPGLNRFLVTSPDIVEATQQTPASLTVKGIHLGSTIILLWEREGLRTIRIQVNPSHEEIQLRNKLIEEGSPFYRLRKERSFKINFEDTGSILEIGKSHKRLNESNKVNDQKILLSGDTPAGNVRSSLFMEYKKDAILNRSVWRPRDFWIDLKDSPLPILSSFDTRLFDNYFSVNDFSLPYVRYNGLTFSHPPPNQFQKKPGTLEPTFVVGQLRDGGYLDNPASILNRKLKGKIYAQNFDYYFQENAKIFAGSAHRWEGPKLGQGSFAYHGGYDIQVQKFRFKGTIGQDDLRRHALKIQNSYESPSFSLENEFRNLNKDYRTVDGPVAGRGYLGTKNSIHLIPFESIFHYDKISLNVETEIYQDRTFSNPNRPEAWNFSGYSDATWGLPYGFYLRPSFNYRDNTALAFPYVQQRLNLRLSKTLFTNWFFLKNIQFFSNTDQERYSEAVETPGFNSSRFGYGGGVNASLLEGFWLSFSYLGSQLEEKEPNPFPTKTHPYEVVYAFGYSHKLFNWPATVDFSLRNLKRSDTLGKLHQPFNNENRFETSFGFGWTLQNGTNLFLQTSTSSAESLLGQPKVAELFVNFGIKIPWDTGIYVGRGAVVQGYFFEDTNANGEIDKGEKKLDGMGIAVKDGPKSISDKNGHYKFSVREGPLTLIATSRLPKGYYYTTSNQISIELAPSEEKEVHFGIASYSSVKGRVYVDENENLVFDAGDKPVSGIRLRTSSGQLAVSAEEGYYSILRVPLGPNKLQIDLDSIPLGYQTLTPIYMSFEGKAGEEFKYDVAFKIKRTLSGKVFIDTNGDGVKSEDEEGVQNITVRFQDREVQTDKKGRFVFENVKPASAPQFLELKKESLPARLKPVKETQEITVEEGPFSKQDANFALQKK